MDDDPRTRHPSRLSPVLSDHTHAEVAEIVRNGIRVVFDPVQPAMAAHHPDRTVVVMLERYVRDKRLTNRRLILPTEPLGMHLEQMHYEMRNAPPIPPGYTP